MRTKHTCPKVTSCTSSGCGGYTYSFNAAGQKIGSGSTISGDPAAGTTSYQYDQLSRLTTYTPPTDAATKTQTYAWNATPDRASVTPGTAPALTTTYDAASHPVGGSYASDLEGRITKMPAPDGTDTLTLTWDILGRLTGVSNSNGTNTTYGYDPLDRLETITSGSGTTSLVYVGLTDAVATSTSGTAVTVHANDLDGTELYEYTVTSGSSGTPTPAYLERDDHGDVTWTTDESGAPSGHAAYDPFGGLTSSSAGFPSTRWQGSWYEANSGLYYVIARWYSPTLGEFLSDDPLSHDTTDPQARDPYAYASGDPIDGSDPSGQCIAGPDLYQGCGGRSGPVPAPKAGTCDGHGHCGTDNSGRDNSGSTTTGPPPTFELARRFKPEWFSSQNSNTNASQLMGCGAPLGHVKATSKHPEMFGQGCLVTSAAMVISYMFGKPYTPLDWLHDFGSHITSSKDDKNCDMTSGWKYNGISLSGTTAIVDITHHIKTRHKNNKSTVTKLIYGRDSDPNSLFQKYVLTKIWHELAAGRPVVAYIHSSQVSTHFVVIVGWQNGNSSKNGNFEIEDPAQANAWGSGGQPFFHPAKAHPHPLYWLAGLRTVTGKVTT